jgi:SAM-dependent methyltransferase
MSNADGDYRQSIFETYRTHTYQHRTSLDAAGVEKSAQVHARFLADYLPQDPAASILEIGTGNGGFLVCCRNLGYSKVSGIDISGEQVEYCHELGFKDVEVSDGLAYLQGSDRRFSCIVLSDVLDHIPKGQVVDLFGEIRLLLAPGGRVILRVPNMSNPLNIRTRYVDFTHEVGFSKESLQQVLRVSDFEVDSIFGTFQPDPRWPFRLIFDVLLWRFFVQLYRRTLHLSDDVIRGKNLIAVGTRKEI